MSAASVAWAKRNPEKVAEIKRRFNERNKERIAIDRAIAFQMDKSKSYASVKKWSAKNPDKVKGQQLRRALREKQRKLGNELRYNYDITFEQYERISIAQGDVCIICQRPNETSRTKRLFVDHNHTTGRLRGLLCHACNMAIGFLREDPEIFTRAIAYLKAFEGEPEHEAWDDDVIAILNRGGWTGYV
jgi:hypothetical protein